MWRMVLVAMLALAGCDPPDTSPGSGSGVDTVQGWTLASGKPPSRAEYTALVASCQQGAVRSAQGKPLEACLADLGLRKE
ncbi:MAG: hypothetical protein AB7H90_14610 [Alphaproteobacteria bacterium]